MTICIVICERIDFVSHLMPACFAGVSLIGGRDVLMQKAAIFSVTLLKL